MGFSLPSWKILFSQRILLPIPTMASSVEAPAALLLYGISLEAAKTWKTDDFGSNNVSLRFNIIGKHAWNFVNTCTKYPHGHIEYWVWIWLGHAVASKSRRSFVRSRQFGTPETLAARTIVQALVNLNIKIKIGSVVCPLCKKYRCLGCYLCLKWKVLLNEYAMIEGWSKVQFSKLQRGKISSTFVHTCMPQI